MSSIFGDTHAGVPSPNVFHVHPYVTRYHGMNLTVPRFPAPYVERPYAVAPYSGSPDGLGSPDGAALTFAQTYDHPGDEYAAAIRYGIMGAAGGAALGAAAGVGVFGTRRPAAALATALGVTIVSAIVAGFAAGYKSTLAQKAAGLSCTCSPPPAPVPPGAPAAVQGLGGTCGCAGMPRAGGTRADLAALGSVR